MPFKVIDDLGKKLNTNNFPTKKKAQEWILKNKWVKTYGSSYEIVRVKRR